MEDNIKIEKMTLRDFDQICEGFEKKFDNFWTCSVLKSELSSPNREYFALKKGSIIKGFAGILLNENELEIMNIVVEINERNKGYGSVLMNQIVSFAEERKYNKIFLEVNEKNYEAIKLYEKFGFSKIGVRKKYYNNIDDAILYEKVL